MRKERVTENPDSARRAFTVADDAEKLAQATTERRPDHTDMQRADLSTLFDLLVEDNENALEAVRRAKPQIIGLVEKIIEEVKKGGRPFYIGAGSAGRYGVLDAAECSPTFGADSGDVIALIAGGDEALRHAVEGAEDDEDLAWHELLEFDPGEHDIVIGLTASGRTPYVVGGLKEAQDNGLTTGCIVCNEDSDVESVSDFPVVAVVGPAPVAGSTRMGAGTAQKIILNMLSTILFTKLGYIYNNFMVNMKLSNKKLRTRAVREVTRELNADNDHDRVVLESEVVVTTEKIWAQRRAQEQDPRVSHVLGAFAAYGHMKARAILEECAELGNKYAIAELESLQSLTALPELISE